MGGQNEKPKPRPQPTLEDILLDMRMQAKSFERDSRKAEKEKNQCIAKARVALQKGNEEGAKLYLGTAATKQTESQQMLRMAHKMDALVVQLKGNTSSQKMVEQISRLTPVLNQQVQNFPVEQLYANLNQFENAMDEIMVNGRVMDQVLNQNNTMQANQDVAVDQMMQQLKQENLNDLQNNMLGADNPLLFNELKANQNLAANQNSQQINDLKKI